MVNRNFTSAPKDIDKLPDTRAERLIPSDTARTKHITADEIIASLAGAYENVRARQVGEWERSQRAFFGRKI
ncbi:hypothetical protein [Leptolyngbya sp. 7M]|uniref:hypothetical protein n=1 Tax=Leptolyngbya sp. 7M TaxID=2812896 RepID=UPI001B8AC4CE|nr:hypothetical protein [Leptolyngbya sp. 7M]QYO66144.1 hypothetical protein JVX88_04915 [Leptolyngbya sp. 7M]